ncbi:SURF1 family protein [Acuticoccus sp. I52.16.1]|uniref:SURF1 family protein n=1 Tax=Acuticoccus sp. I52.16.1 TaxID=2928472 RepID=UPI001FD2AA63|nr:SURF1 family protein [Acuticoccus sp. I52.16.1]UOM32833.1 SURF1 family protein [Acuticoccus sp. I52.16.1]
MRRLLLAVAIAGAFVILIGLGTWQLQRLEWKEALIAAAAERPAAPAVPAPGPDEWGSRPAAFPIDDWRYRRVALTGSFAPVEAFFWIALGEPNGPLGGPGYMVLVPFVTEDGWTVLVNRGFIPEDRRDPATRPDAAPPRGTVTVEGLIRRDDPPSFITPAPDTAARIFYARDIGAIAEALGAPGPIAPYQIDLVAEETPAGGLPQAGESRITFTNNHLGYALTWYGLAAALLGVSGVALWRRRARG